MERSVRYRAPTESGQKLVAPPWNALGDVIEANVAWRQRNDFDLLGRSLSAIVAEARREILERASAEDDEALGGTHGRRAEPDGKSEIRVSEKLGHDMRVTEKVGHGGPFIVTGHQPGLVHPGVWLKNFAAVELARAHGGVGVHVVIDADLCRSTSILVPGGSAAAPQFTPVAFDRPAEAMPWEERRILDEGVWRAFPDEVHEAAGQFVQAPFLDRWWPTAERFSAITGTLGAALAKARHAAEIGWGFRSAELPQSGACQTSAFRWFVCAVMAELPRFSAAYNGALREYRSAHRLRNRMHPAPNLGNDGGWHEAPLWMWTTHEPRRRPVFVRPASGGFDVSDRRGVERFLPLRSAGDAASAVEALAAWEAEGLKIRSRALVTTMFLRLAVADLFLHGIGGAHYDEATDAICERFFGVAPPAFAAVSGTLHLPIDLPPHDPEAAPRLQQQLRALQYHPERQLDFATLANGRHGEAQAIADEKMRWVQLPKQPENAAARHQGITQANAALQTFVANDRANLERQLAGARQQTRILRVLASREYAFCLFPKPMLEQFLLDFSPAAL